VRGEVQCSRLEVGIDTGAREHKAAATTAGILYIIGTVAGILSKAIASFRCMHFIGITESRTPRPRTTEADRRRMDPQRA
jgi:hypothetical protein